MYKKNEKSENLNEERRISSSAENNTNTSTVIHKLPTCRSADIPSLSRVKPLRNDDDIPTGSSMIERFMDSTSSNKYNKLSIPPFPSPNNLERDFHSTNTKVQSFPSPPGKDFSLHADQTKNQDYNYVVPCKPLFLRHTHFICLSTVNSIIQTIPEVLLRFPEITSEYVESIYQWKGAYVKGSIYCEFSISLFQNEVGHIVEGMRLKGEASPFFQIFNAISCQLSSKSEKGAKSPLDNRQNTLLSYKSSFVSLRENHIEGPDFRSHENTLKASKSLIQMAEESHEGKLEASKTFCDMSCRDEYRQALAESGCIPLLAKLTTYQHCECTRRNSVLALSNLSESPNCQGGIIESGVLPTLLTNCVDGPYASSEMRRASARIIANISARFASTIVEKIGSTVLRDWMVSIDDIMDSKLKVQADRAKEFLQKPVFA